LCGIPDRTIHGLRGGISTERFSQFLMDLMLDWKIIDVYRERASEAIEFQYTYWPDPDNRTARGQEFINVCIAVLCLTSYFFLELFQVGLGARENVCG